MHKTIKARRIAQLIVLSTACLLAAPRALAQQLDFPGASVEDPVALSKAMPELARQVIAVYRDDDRQKFLDNLFRLQMVAGQYADAVKTMAALRALRAGDA